MSFLKNKPKNEPKADPLNAKRDALEAKRERLARLLTEVDALSKEIATEEQPTFPRAVYHGRKGSHVCEVVQDATALEALGDGWVESPADLED
jgi:hypothetical protein